MQICTNEHRIEQVKETVFLGVSSSCVTVLFYRYLYFVVKKKEIFVCLKSQTSPFVLTRHTEEAVYFNLYPFTNLQLTISRFLWKP